MPSTPRSRPSRPPTGPRSRRWSSDKRPTSSSRTDDFVSLPVDFRDCRARSCADTIRPGSIRAHPDRVCRRSRSRTWSTVAHRSFAGRPRLRRRARRLRLSPVLALLPRQPHPRPRPGRRLSPRRLGVASRRASDADGGVVSRASSHHGYNGRSGGLGQHRQRHRVGARARPGTPGEPVTSRRIRESRRDDRSPSSGTTGRSIARIWSSSRPSRWPDRPGPTSRSTPPVGEGGLARSRVDGHLSCGPGDCRRAAGG